MKLTVVVPVRAAESSQSQPIEKLTPLTNSNVPSRSAFMDLPLAETVIRLDFQSEDFQETIPGPL
jgi:hypothetical protein